MRLSEISIFQEKQPSNSFQQIDMSANIRRKINVII